MLVWAQACEPAFVWLGLARSGRSEGAEGAAQAEAKHEGCAEEGGAETVVDAYVFKSESHGEKERDGDADGYIGCQSSPE